TASVVSNWPRKPWNHPAAATWCRSARFTRATTAPVSTSARATKRLARKRAGITGLQLPGSLARDEIHRKRVRVRASVLLVEVVVEGLPHGLGARDSSPAAISGQLLLDTRRYARVDDAAHWVLHGMCYEIIQL